MASRQHIYWVVTLGTDATCLVDRSSDLTDVDALCDVVAAAVEGSRATATLEPSSQPAPRSGDSDATIATVVDFLVAEYGRAGLPPLFSRNDAVACLEGGDQRAWDRTLAFLYGCCHEERPSPLRLLNLEDSASAAAAAAAPTRLEESGSSGLGGEVQQLVVPATEASIAAATTTMTVTSAESSASPQSTHALDLVGVSPASAQRQLLQKKRRARAAQRKATAEAEARRAEAQLEAEEAQRVATAADREDRVRRAQARARARVRARAASKTAPWVPPQSWNASTLTTSVHDAADAGSGKDGSGSGGGSSTSRAEAWEVPLALRDAGKDAAAASRRPMGEARAAPCEGLYVGAGMWDPTFHRNQRSLSKLGLTDGSPAAARTRAAAAARRTREAWTEPPQTRQERRERGGGRRQQQQQQPAMSSRQLMRAAQRERAAAAAAQRERARTQRRKTPGRKTPRVSYPVTPARGAAIVDGAESETRKRLAFTVVKNGQRTANLSLSDKQSALVKWIDEQGVPLSDALPVHRVGQDQQRRICTPTTVVNALRDGVVLCELAAAVAEMDAPTPVPRPRDDGDSLQNLNAAFAMLQVLPHMPQRHTWAHAAVRSGKIDTVWALLGDIRLAWARSLQEEQKPKKSNSRRAATARKARDDYSQRSSGGRTPATVKSRGNVVNAARARRRAAAAEPSDEERLAVAAKEDEKRRQRANVEADNLENSLGLPNVSRSQRHVAREWLEGMGLRVAEQQPLRRPAPEGRAPSALPRIDAADGDSVCNGVLICTVVAILEAPVGSSSADGARYAPPNRRPRSWVEAQENVAHALFALRSSNARWTARGRIAHATIKTGFRIPSALIAPARVLAITSGANASAAAWALLVMLMQRGEAVGIRTKRLQTSSSTGHNLPAPTVTTMASQRGRGGARPASQPVTPAQSRRRRRNGEPSPVGASGEDIEQHLVAWLRACGALRASGEGTAAPDDIEALRTSNAAMDEGRLLCDLAEIVVGTPLRGVHHHRVTNKLARANFLKALSHLGKHRKVDVQVLGLSDDSIARLLAPTASPPSAVDAARRLAHVKGAVTSPKRVRLWRAAWIDLLGACYYANEGRTVSAMLTGAGPSPRSVIEDAAADDQQQQHGQHPMAATSAAAPGAATSAMQAAVALAVASATMEASMEALQKKTQPEVEVLRTPSRDLLPQARARGRTPARDRAEAVPPAFSLMSSAPERAGAIDPSKLRVRRIAKWMAALGVPLELPDRHESDVAEDFCDGVLLCELVDKLLHVRGGIVGLVKQPKSGAQGKHNIQIALELLRTKKVRTSLSLSLSEIDCETYVCTHPCSPPSSSPYFSTRAAYAPGLLV